VIAALAEQHRDEIDPAQFKAAKELLHERPPSARRLLS
jgi:hypothetical protein